MSKVISFESQPASPFSSPVCLFSTLSRQCALLLLSKVRHVCPASQRDDRFLRSSTLGVGERFDHLLPPVRPYNKKKPLTPESIFKFSHFSHALLAEQQHHLGTFHDEPHSTTIDEFTPLIYTPRPKPDTCHAKAHKYPQATKDIPTAPFSKGQRTNWHWHIFQPLLCLQNTNEEKCPS